MLKGGDARRTCTEVVNTVAVWSAELVVLAGSGPRDRLDEMSL